MKTKNFLLLLTFSSGCVACTEDVIYVDSEFGMRYIMQERPELLEKVVYTGRDKAIEKVQTKPNSCQMQETF